MAVPLLVLGAAAAVADVVAAAEDAAVADHRVHLVLDVQRVAARVQVVLVEVLEVVVHHGVLD